MSSLAVMGMGKAVSGRLDSLVLPSLGAFLNMGTKKHPITIPELWDLCKHLGKGSWSVHPPCRRTPVRPAHTWGRALGLLVSFG